MSNRRDKPKQTAEELISKMKNKGITFHYTTEKDAKEYLTNVNNYLRTTAYRKNYQKYNKGMNYGKYIYLDFSYLQELSTIDMHFRFLILKMCSDIEHALKVQILKDIEMNSETDGYDIVSTFLKQNPYIINKIESSISSSFTGDLIGKYFTIRLISGNRKKRKWRIISYDDCPAWVLMELLTFGDFIRFYGFYYISATPSKISLPVLHLVKSLRNAAAHNNCLLANLSHGTSHAPKEISKMVRTIPSIHSNQRRKKLSCRPMLEFTALLYVYNLTVSDKVMYHRIKELKDLFFSRMLYKKDFFQKNELIKSNYEFACKIIKALFIDYH